MIRLLIVDVVPAAWPAGAHVEDLDRLLSSMRLAAVADTQLSNIELWHALDEQGLARFFERVGTSTDFGRPIDAVAVRRMLSTLGVGASTCLVATIRPELHSGLAGTGILSLFVEPDADLAAAVTALSR